MTDDQQDETRPVEGGPAPAGAPVSGAPSLLSRRGFLAAVAAAGGTAVAGGILWKVLADDDDSGGSGDRAAPKPRLNAAGTMEVQDLHFALAEAGLSAGARLYVGGKVHQLTPHDGDSRDRLLTSHPVLSAVDAALISHYVEGVELPTDQVVHCRVLDGTDDDGYPTADTRYVGTKVHVPAEKVAAARAKQADLGRAVAAYANDRKVRRAVADVTAGRGSLADVKAALDASEAPNTKVLGGSPERYALLGMAPADHPTTPEATQALDAVVSYHDTAVALTMKHPEVLRLDPESAALVRDLAATAPAVTDFGNTILSILRSTPRTGTTTTIAGDTDNLGSLGTFEPVLDPAGKPVTLPQDLLPAPNTTPIHVLSLKPALNRSWAAASVECIDLAKRSDNLKGFVWLPYESDPLEVQKPAPAPTLQGQEGALVDPGLTGDGVTGTHYGMRISVTGVETEANTIKLKVANDFLRHIMLMAQFYKDDGTAIPLTEGTYGGGSPFNSPRPESPTMGPLDLVGSATTFMGATIPGMNSTNTELIFPADAVSARVFMASLPFRLDPGKDMDKIVGTDGKPLYPDLTAPPDAIAGAFFTFLLDLMLPSILMVHGITEFKEAAEIRNDIFYPYVEGATGRQDLRKGWDEIMGVVQKKGDNPVRAIGAAVVLATGTVELLNGADLGSAIGNFLKEIVLEAVGLMLDVKLLKPLAEWLITTFFAEELIRCIPFVGEVLAALGVIENAAKLTSSLVELGISPAMQTATVIPTYTATLTVKPDPKDGVLPQTATSFQVLYRIAGKKPSAVTEGPLDGSSSLPSLSVSIGKVPLGGTISWEVSLLNKDGFLVGKASSEELPNSSLAELAGEVELEIEESLVPIGSSTTFERGWTLDATDGSLRKAKKADVPGGIGDLDPSASSETKIGTLGSVSVATRQGVVAETWQASAAWHVRALDIRSDPVRSLPLAKAFTLRPLVVLDALSSDPANASNFLLDPLDSGGALVRPLGIGAAGLEIDDTKAHGRFTMEVDSACFNPHGFVVGLNSESARLEIVSVADPTRPNAVAPLAQAGAGGGSRPGLMERPVLVTCRVDGTVIVLTDKPTLHAFDVAGQPIPTFAGRTTTFVDLSAAGGSRAYVGLATDGGDCTYVLSYAGAGAAADFRLDVYDRDGKVILQQDGVNAGRFVVDYWRVGYSLNFLPVAGPNGMPFRDPGLGAIEPQISNWLPQG